MDGQTRRNTADDTTDPMLADDVLQRIGERATHPDGPRRYDYRPDVQGLAAAVRTGLALHPRAPAPRLCPGCHQPQPCETRRGMEDALLREWRQAAAELLGVPAVPSARRWFEVKGAGS